MRAANELKREAERLRVGLAFGLVDPGDAVAWADRLIESSECPPAEWMVDISLAEGAAKKDWGGLPESPKDIGSALRRVPGDANLEEVVRAILGDVRARYATRQWDEFDVIKAASRARFQVHLPDDVELWIIGLEDALALHDDGVFDRNALARNVNDFFERFCP